MKPITQNVETAVELFIETEQLKFTDINAERGKWHNLYSQECKLFDIMRNFKPEENYNYKRIINALSLEAEIITQSIWKEKSESINHYHAISILWFLRNKLAA
jgi:hypothetical protein